MCRSESAELDRSSVYQIPENLPARVAWRLATMYRLQPGDSIVHRPGHPLPFSGVMHYSPEHADELESIRPFLVHVSGPSSRERPALLRRAPNWDRERWRLRVDG